MKPESISTLRHVEKALREMDLPLTRYLADDIATVIVSENAEAELEPGEIAEITAGDWIEAIKKVRARTHLGLHEAKDLVEKVGERLGRFDPHALKGSIWKRVAGE